MQRPFRKTLVIAVAAVLFSAFGAGPARAAAVGSAVLTGTITPDPILAAASSPGATFSMNMSLSGTAALVIGTTPTSCFMTANTIGTTNVVTGSGSGNMTCNGSAVTGGAFSITCSFTYVQTGWTFKISGGCSGPGGNIIEATCKVKPFATTGIVKCVLSIL